MLPTVAKAGVGSRLGQWIADNCVSSVPLSSFTYCHQTDLEKTRSRFVWCCEVLSPLSQSPASRSWVHSYPAPAALGCAAGHSPTSGKTAQIGLRGTRSSVWRWCAKKEMRKFTKKIIFLEWEGRKGSVVRHLQPQCCLTSACSGFFWCCLQVTEGA